MGRLSKIDSSVLTSLIDELRAPLNMIVGAADLAIREDPQDSVRSYLRTVKQAGLSLLSIVDDITAYSRIESGSVPVMPAYYLLSSVINDVVNIFRMKIAGSGILFAVNIDGGIPDALIGDEFRIRQLLISLLNGVVKNASAGSVSLTVGMEYTGGAEINLIIKTRSPRMPAARGGAGMLTARSLVNVMGGKIFEEAAGGAAEGMSVSLPQRVHSRIKMAEVENPGEKNVCVFVGSGFYADSIAMTLGNLGVHYIIEPGGVAGFEKTLSEYLFTHVFVSYSLYEAAKSILARLRKNVNIVLLAEPGENAGRFAYTALEMPAYAIPVANLLNGVACGYEYGDDGGNAAGFIAPDINALIVDDVPVNLKITKGLLAPYKINADFAGSGAEAVEAVKAKRYDIVFMDYRMPGMDGAEAVRRIKAQAADGFKPVIIALTANSVLRMRDSFIRKGFDDFLPKPIETAKLYALLEKWIPESMRKTAPGGGAGRYVVEIRELNAPLRIDGLDIQKGISYTGGTVGYYLKTLSLFYEDGATLTDKIIASLGDGNITLYTIYMHALKSAAENVGATELSNMAGMLEIAGRQEDTDYLNAWNGIFLKNLENLLVNIKKTLDENNPDNGSNGRAAVSDELIESLNVLKSALNDMDAGVINRTVDSLARLSPPVSVRSALKSITNNILLAEYDEASGLIDSLLSEIAAS